MSWRGRISQCALRSAESPSYPLETRIPLCYRLFNSPVAQRSS
jgi:hypothetical protein